MKKFVLFQLLVVMVSSCCFPQMSTQFYFANDSCDYYLPDYSKAITVRDNCCVRHIYQTPMSGQKLVPGEDITVRLQAMDCYGNKKSMQFDVVLIDTIPPTFFYDSTLFFPAGMYQNENRTYLLYFTVDSSEMDKWGNYPTTLAYRNLYGKAPRDNNRDTTDVHENHFSSAGHRKRAFFTAGYNYTVDEIYLPMKRINAAGDPPEGDFVIEVWEMTEDDQPIKKVAEKHQNAGYLTAWEELIWHRIEMNSIDTVRVDQRYCVEIHYPNADDKHQLVWWTNRDITEGKYLMYTYTGGEEWGHNYEGSYMFELWGTLIK